MSGVGQTLLLSLLFQRDYYSIIFISVAIVVCVDQFSQFTSGLARCLTSCSERGKERGREREAGEERERERVCVFMCVREKIGFE